MPAPRPRSRALLLGALLLATLGACGDGGGSDGGSARDEPGAGGTGGDRGAAGRPVGAGVVASTATPYAPPPAAPAPEGPGAPAVGSCLAETSFASSKQRLGLGPAAPCAEPHAAQVVAVVGLPREKVDAFVDGGGPMTGGTLSAYNVAVVQVVTESRVVCQPAFDALATSVLDLGPDADGDRRVWGLEEEIRIPSPDEWDAGARWAACVVEAEEYAPITGVPDITVATADEPMPVGLQVCGNVTGRRVPCDDEIVQVQEFLQVALEVPADATGGGLATAEAKAAATERCSAALASYAPELADDADVQVFATQEMAQEQQPDGKVQMIGQPLATCAVSPTAAKGLGLPALVP